MNTEAEGQTRVLLVDDDADVRRDYARLLGRIGCDVDTAANGLEAIERLRVGTYDVVVSDIAMPGMSGLAFLREVREHDLDVPVVLITGDPGLETAVSAVEYGAFRYLTKPVDVETAGAVLRRAAQVHRLAQLKREALAAVGIEGKALGDRVALEARFSRALDTLWMAFQPIVRWSERRVFGYEALVRTREPALASPLDLLDAAERLGRMQDLGRAIRRLVAEASANAGPDATLFVNLHALDLNDFELYAESAPLSAVASRVVLEITERASLDAVSGLGARVAKLRRLGYRIAIDDLGAGYAGLATFTQVEPDVVKLDRCLVQDVNALARKRSIVRSLVRLCGRDLGMLVVGEGVETAEERDVLELEGCDLLQGYLFGRPGPDFPEARL